MRDSGELLKSLANHLARAAGKDKALDVFRLLKHANILSLHPDGSDDGDVVGQDVGTSMHPEPGTDRVGIWERKKPSHNFVRRLDVAADWHLWANVGRIPSKQRRRVVLIGESVARGYLYDPQFNPARALESILQAHFGQQEIEVVDLARTNMKLEEIKVLASSALLLEPDVVIIFAGNNWLGAGFHTTRTSDLATALRESGVAGIKDVMEQKHQQAVTETIEQIGTMYGSRKIPLVWVIPEFNLGDWRDPVTNAPYLPNDGNREWMDLYSQALRALEDDDCDDAGRNARSMLELDSGTSATAYYVLAECARRKDDLEALRLWMESARDAVLWAPYLKTPRPYSLTHRTLREELVKYPIQVVDLPGLFSEYLDQELPDRRLFLDYCHLNAEGIQIAMAAVASRVVRTFGGPDLAWSSLRGLSASPSSAIRAEALFLAAVHNAHWHQPLNLVEHFCREALTLHPEIFEIMACFAEVQTRRIPMLMGRSAAQIADPRFPSVQRYLLRFNIHQMDKVLIDAIVAALQGRGTSIKPQLDRLRMEEGSVLHSRVDLLDPYYCSSASHEFAQQEAEVMKIAESRGDYYKAYSPVSSFLFVGEAGHSLVLCLAGRLPVPGQVQGSVSVELNGEFQAQMSISQRWQTWEIPVEGRSVKDGLNIVTICWPSEEIPGRTAVEAAADEMLSDFFPDLYPIFGEIHSFTVSLPVHMEEKGTDVPRSALSFTS